LSQPLSVFGLTDIGRVRKRNEDSIALVPEAGIAVVADGMGGHPGGDIASQIASTTAATMLEDASRRNPTSDQLVPSLRQAMTGCVATAHRDIRARGESQPELDGMGTTLTALVVHPETKTYVLGHVGDSRAYLFRRDSLTQLTRDDTWVQDRVDRGDIDSESARKHPYAHLLTQCLGLEDPPAPQILDGMIEPGDLFLLCTDGLVGMLDDGQVEAILREAPASNGASVEIAATVQKLLGAANEAGGHDNITAAIVTLGA